jgi:hypothetical protein
MGTDETFARGDEVEQSLFSFRGHGGLSIAAFASEVFGRHEKDRVELLQRWRQEDAAILGAMGVEAVLLAQFFENAIDQAGAIPAELDDRMFKPGGARVDQNFSPFLVVSSRRPSERETRGPCRSRRTTRPKSITPIHRCDLQVAERKGWGCRLV